MDTSSPNQRLLPPEALLADAPAGLAADRIALLETFVRIVEAGSLSAAAPLLRTTQPTISRRLRTLETSLGVQLLQRSTHAMRLTLDGERCYERARTLLAHWAAFEADIGRASAEPQGLLRVAVPHAFGQDKFVAPLAAFLQAHPRITVEWLLMDDVSDSLSRGIDCAIQVGHPTDPGVVAVRLAAVERIVVAAPSLLAGRAVPQDPEALGALPWLALRTYYRDELVLTHAVSGETRSVRMQPRVSTDSLYALRSAALHGLGVCAGSAWLLAGDIARGDLVQLAADWQPAPLPTWITYPHAPHYPSRLLQFVAAMRAAVPRIVEA
ncbi:MAG TPA: LysR family transcriptional regulator [Ramlibacter sp.]|jgi:DNA-binding transcriptional LysR family regulator|uniref:LysR family transcriptional regulator n=1 Tax=Ramlibacter sp. TaxID=1917967 RepID=UPI002D6C972D|nr:LysR family transcriptional regulator [Ramlibacter sp.]HZY17823.1 LysR family transcriptional regulator [Ramlibacter sp.]